MHEQLKAIWRDHAAGLLTDDDAQRAAEAAYARRRAGQGDDTWARPKAASGHARAAVRPRREKVFGMGRCVPLDRNAKVRIVHLARCLMRRTEPGKHYGVVTAKTLAVLQALLWGFHNAKSGLCFPSYETIAEAAGCARSTVHEAIKALEDCGLLSWVNRLKRVREWTAGLPGVGATRVRVLRSSNAYQFPDPIAVKSSKSDLPTGTTTQVFPLLETSAAVTNRMAFDGKIRKF